MFLSTSDFVTLPMYSSTVAIRFSAGKEHFVYTSRVQYHDSGECSGKKQLGSDKGRLQEVYDDRTSIEDECWGESWQPY